MMHLVAVRESYLELRRRTSASVVSRDPASSLVAINVPSSAYKASSVSKSLQSVSSIKLVLAAKEPYFRMPRRISGWSGLLSAE